MKYKFEIKNELGVVTKRGVMKEDEKIPFDITDHSYEITLNKHPYSLIKKGLVPKSKEELDESLPVRYMYELNGVASIWFKEPTEAFLNGELIAGEYLTQLETEKGANVLSFKDQKFFEFRSEKDSPEEIILSASYTAEQEELARKIISSNTLVNAHDRVLYYMRAKETEMHDDELYDAYLILKRIELKHNMRNKWNSKTSWSVSNNIHNKINDAGEIDSVNAYRMINGMRIFMGSYNLDSDRSIHAKEYECIVLDGYKNKQYVSSRIFIEVSGRAKSLVWKKDREAEEQYQRAIERGKLTSIQNEEIDEFLRVHNSFSGINRIMDAPKVFSTTESLIELELPHYDLIEQIEETCYLSFSKVKDFSSSMLLNKIAIHDSIMTIDKFAKGIDDSDDIIVWVETASGVIISDTAALFADDEDMYRASMLESHFSSKNETVLLEAVKEVDPTGYLDIFRDMISNAYDNQALGRLEVYTDILHQMIRNRMYEKSWVVFKSVLSLRNTTISDAKKFFSRETIFNQRRKRLELPFERNCIAIIETFKPSLNRIDTTYSEERFIHLTDDLTIIRFLDKDSYEYSGHITMINNKVIGNENFDIKVVVS